MKEYTIIENIQITHIVRNADEDVELFYAGLPLRQEAEFIKNMLDVDDVNVLDRKIFVIDKSDKGEIVNE